MRHGPVGLSRSDVDLWRIPLGFSLGGLGLFALTMIPDVLDARGVIRLPGWFSMGSIDDARAILGALLSCVSTVLALIFSVSLLVLSMVATLFGPRLLQRFLQDWITQATIGVFMATFVYLCLVFLVTHEDAHSRFVPQTSLITSWLLVLGSFGFLIYYSHRIATSIQNPDMIARIVEDMRPVAARLHAEAGGSGVGLDAGAIARQVAEAEPVAAAHSGYIQEIDAEGLIAEAARADVVVHFLYRPGQFVLRGEAMARCWPPGRLGEAGSRIGRHVGIGRHRVLKQDCGFGIAQVVEIAIRALSPAVNDTFTGVGCVDWLGDALLVVAERPPGDGWRRDGAGSPRLHVPPARLEWLVGLAFDQIRQAAADNPAVLIRILDIIARLAPRVGDEAARRALLAQADAVWEVASARVGVRKDRDDVEAAWRRARAVGG